MSGVTSKPVSSEDLKKEYAVTKNADDDDDEIDFLKYPMRELSFTPAFFKEPISFNPLVSGLGVFFLWGLAIWSMVDPEGSNELLVGWRGKVALYFSWLFIGSKCAFFFFLVYVIIRYYNVKLGGKDEKPEFETFEYFAMIFAAGVAVGLFVFGVAEPLWHLNDNWYAASGYHTDDERAMFAINLTVANWGIAGWAPYLIVAVNMGLAGHRFHLPMTFRSCLYPIFGDYTWGWIGDIIDGFTIVVTVSGVCTSLGLGAIQIVSGFQHLGWVDSEASIDRLSTIQNLTIWGITAIATASVISGLNAGVKLLSMLAFGLGMLLLFLVFVMDNTKHLMNLIVQECGYFLQYNLLELNFWTDAYAQLGPGEGRATDGNAGAVWYMDAWIIFYQAWWVSWSAFVGLFVARISRGRTVGQVITYSLVAPIMYCILWFCIWGGTGIRQHRQALELEALGETHFGDPTFYQVPGNDFCFDVPQQTEYNSTGDGVIFENTLLGVTPVCKFDTGAAEFSAFNVLSSFSFPDSFDSGLGPILSVLFIISLAIYFATSSDSGSLIVDHLASNGRRNHHWLQRLFWAVTEGAVATAILSAGGRNALQAVQAASIVFGLPFVFILIYMMQSIQQFLDQAVDPDNETFVLPQQKEFSFPVYGGIFNMCEWMASAGSVNPIRVEKGMHQPTQAHVVEFIKGLFIPSFSLWQILRDTYPRSPVSNALMSGLHFILFYGWVAVFAAYSKYTGLKGPAWAVFFSTAMLLTTVRMSFRSRFNIRSNVVGDFMSSLFFWPQVLAQMRLHCVELNLPNDKADEDYPLKEESQQSVLEEEEMEA